MIQIIIFGAGSLNILIGILVLLQSKRTREIFSFGVFSFVTGMWGLSNFLVYYYNDVVFVKSTYAFGALTVSSMLAWSLIYRYPLKSLWKVCFPHFLGILAFVLSYVDGMVIGTVHDITQSGLVADPGMLTDVYSLFVLVFMLWSLWNVFRVYKESHNKERKQSKIILTGLSFFVGTTITVSAVLPIFNILGYTNFDSPSSFVMVVFVTFAIVKYRFLEIKVLLAQILVGSLIIASILQLLNVTSQFGFFVAIISLFIIIVLGIFLIRSVKRDVQQREALQLANLQLERNKAKLSQLNEHLIQIDREKTDFINIASHQLRTPLGSMRWSMEMISNNEFGEIPIEAQEALNQLYENNQRMITLVNDLLNVARIEQGRVIEKQELSNITRILEDAVNTMNVEAKHRKIKLSFESFVNDVPMVMLAPKRFFEVMQNLISNAIKYNRPNGSVTVSLKSSKRYVQINVEDTGIGIPKADQGRIFSKFFRAGNAIASATEGTGLGLFVVKSFVEESNGIVRFKSVENVGTTFTIELPIASIENNNA